MSMKCQCLLFRQRLLVCGVELRSRVVDFFLICYSSLACRRLFFDLLFSIDESESNQSVHGFLKFTVKCNKDPVYRSNFQWA